MIKRITTAIILAFLGFCGVYDENTFHFLIILCGAFCAYELILIQNTKFDFGKYFLILFLIIISSFLSFEINIFAFSIFILLIILSLLIDVNTKFIDNLILIVTTYIIIGAIIGALYIYEIGMRRLVVWLILTNYMTDTGAFFVGISFGKHKLLPHISPKKTIEGSIGGTILGIICGVLFGLLYANSILNDYKFILIGSIVIPILAQVGDLFFSSIKRKYKTKDFGNIFPGHGGMLDRIDSLIFSLYGMYLFMLFLNHGVKFLG